MNYKPVPMTSEVAMLRENNEPLINGVLLQATCLKKKQKKTESLSLNIHIL